MSCPGEDLEGDGTPCARAGHECVPTVEEAHGASYRRIQEQCGCCGATNAVMVPWRWL